MTLDLTPEERRALAGKARAGGAAEGHYQRGPPPLAADTGAAPHSGEAGTAGSREGEHSWQKCRRDPAHHRSSDHKGYRKFPCRSCFCGISIGPPVGHVANHRPCHPVVVAGAADTALVSSHEPAPPRWARLGPYPCVPGADHMTSDRKNPQMRESLPF